MPSEFANRRSDASANSPASPDSRYPALAMNALLIPSSAHCLSSPSFELAGVQKKARSITPTGSSERSATVCTPKIFSRCKLVAYTPPAKSFTKALCSDTKPNFPGWLEAPITTMARGLNNAVKCSCVGTNADWVPLAEEVCWRPISINASTATRDPSLRAMSGLISRDSISGCAAHT